MVDQAPGTPRGLPASTKVPLERINPLLSCNIRSWLQNHGKTVKPKLTEEQKANLRTCFRMMDADGSGAIDAEELGAAFKLLGLSVSRKEVEAMLAEVDRDGSGEVEYAEFLEIMTMQLTRLAAQKEEEETAAAAAAAGRRSAAPQGNGPNVLGDGGEEGGGDVEALGGAAAAAAAASLPFDVVVTAYRRKKLMGALEEDDKDFILSVAAAEEEERRRVEQEAAQGGHRSRRGSMLTPVPQGPDAARLPSHASFLASLSREERGVIEALSKKYRDEFGEAAAAGQPRQPQQRQSSQPRREAPPDPAHLAALHATSRGAALPLGQQTAAAAALGPGQACRTSSAAMHRPGSMPRPASSMLTAQTDFRVQYRLTKSATPAGAGAPASQEAAAAAAGGGTEGLRLPVPQYSSSMFANG